MLNSETLRLFRANAQPRILADYIVESAAGQKLAHADRDAALTKAGRQLIRGESALGAVSPD